MVNVSRLLAIALLSTTALFAQDDNLSRALAGADLLAETLADRSRDGVRFEGSRTLPEDELRQAIAVQIQEILASGLTAPRADDAAYYLAAHYRKSGFAHADVTYRIAGKQLTLVIREGPRTLLSGVKFSGNTTFTEAQLADYLIGAPLTQLTEKPEQFPYNAGSIAAGADRVRDFYLSEGYLDATVDASEVAMSAGDTRATVTVRIVEGHRYTFGAVRFIEPLRLLSEDELRTALGESPTGAYSAGKVVTMQRNLQSHFRSRGYFEAKVAADADPTRHAGGAVPVTFRIAAGALYRFGAVHVRNDGGRLHPDFLPKRFEHLAGQTYDPEQLDETFREMLRTSLFNNLRITTTARGGQFVDLDLLAEEAPAREVGFTLGYGSYDGATIGVRLGDRNLFGRGRPISFGADWSQRGLHGELLYVDPWLLDTRFSLRSRLYSALREEEGYSKSALGLRFDLGRQVAPNLEVATFASVEKVAISDATIDPVIIGLTDYLLTDIGLTLNYDRRDDPIGPTRGFFAGAALDFGLLDGEPAFTRGTVRFSYYLPLPKKCLLALGGRVGAISPIVDTIPIDVRFFNGGANSVRSFAERDLGPKDAEGNPLGGEFFTVFNAEFIFPLWKALQGAVFVDAGNLTDFDRAGLSEMRYGIGAGLRYKLPVGPLRLDYGVNPSPRADEERGAFHFSFGFAF
jgi:outer membrane protein assembly complex protein YaeT